MPIVLLVAALLLGTTIPSVAQPTTMQQEPRTPQSSTQTTPEQKDDLKSWNPSNPNYYPAILATISEIAYDPYSAEQRLPSNWEVVLPTNPLENRDGFKAIAVFNKSNNVLVIGFAGTNILSSSDLLADAQTGAHTVASFLRRGADADKLADRLNGIILSVAALPLDPNSPLQHDVLGSKLKQATAFVTASKT